MEYDEQHETNLSLEVFSYLNSNCITQQMVVETEMFRTRIRPTLKTMKLRLRCSGLQAAVIRGVKAREIYLARSIIKQPHIPVYQVNFAASCLLKIFLINCNKKQLFCFKDKHSHLQKSLITATKPGYLLGTNILSMILTF